MKIILIGYRCTGKTTIGRKLADYLDMPFSDTDDLIASHADMSISRIVEKWGWEKFRELETRMLQDTLGMDSAVISTGGGIVLDRSNRRSIRLQGICIWLQASDEIIIQRLYKDAGTQAFRPRLSDLDVVAETSQLMKQRKPLYEETCHISIDTGMNSPDECVTQICRRLKDVRL